MKISAYKNPVVQPWLFDDLGNHGHVRNVVGALCDRLTRQLVGGKSHRTDCTCDYCPDVSANGVYFESKAVGNSNQAFVYGGRLEKDREFVAAGHRLVYVIWRHGAESKLAKTVTELEQLVLATMKRVIVVPFVAVSAICANLVPDKLNSKYGGSDERPEYGSGYRMPLSLFDRWTHHVFENGYVPR